MSANKTAGSSGENSGRGTTGRFEKGNRYRWPKGASGNPKGRPTSHDELRELIQDIAAEDAGAKSKFPRLVSMLRKMMTSKNAADHVAVLEHGYGKVPQKLETWQDDVLRALPSLTHEQRAALYADLVRTGFESDAIALFAKAGIAVAVNEDAHAG